MLTLLQKCAQRPRNSTWFTRPFLSWEGGVWGKRSGDYWVFPFLCQVSNLDFWVHGWLYISGDDLATYEFYYMPRQISKPAGCCLFRLAPRWWIIPLVISLWCSTVSLASINTCMILRYFISLFGIDTADFSPFPLSTHTLLSPLHIRTHTHTHTHTSIRSQMRLKWHYFDGSSHCDTWWLLAMRCVMEER